MLTIHPTHRSVNHVRQRNFEHFSQAVCIQEYLFFMKCEVDTGPVQNVPYTPNIILHVTVVEEVMHPAVEEGTSLEAVYNFIIAGVHEVPA